MTIKDMGETMEEHVIVEKLMQASQMIEQGQFEQAYKVASQMVENHSEMVNERMRAEMHLLLKQMEYKSELKEYSQLQEYRLIFKYCEGKYGKFGRNLEEAWTEKELPEQDTIWWCWLQGKENAPGIVQQCYKTLEKLGRKIVVLSHENIQDYVELPDFIEEKYRTGIISRTHYSDILRLELLTQKGGTWVDATVWISGTEQIVPIIEQEYLFMFHAGNVSDYIIYDSWFMHARKRSLILESAKKMLYAYWKEEEELKNYFLVHLLITLACQYYDDEYKRIPLFSNEPAHVLQHDLFKPYGKRRWEQIIAMSDVHKLTYKYQDEVTKGSFLDYLLNQ